MNQLNEKKCKPCEGGVAPLTQEKINELLTQLDHWQYDAKEITKTFTFKNFFRVMSFVNAVAHISNQENHHPTLEVSYNQCVVRYTTHAINGLSDNDFICAKKVDCLI